MPNAYFAVAPNEAVTSYNWNPGIIARFRLPHGNYILIARATIRNLDTDDQRVTLQITTGDGAVLIDSTDVWMGSRPDDGGFPISLEGTTQVAKESICDLRFITYKGIARDGRIIAIPVTNFEDTSFP